MSYPAPRGVPGLIRDVSERRPDHPALVDGDRRLTYRELELASDLVAERIRALGPLTAPVVLFLPRSAETVIAILGVLKAGAAYLPIDPDEPDARREAMLARSRPTVGITSTARAHTLAAAGLTVIDIDGLAGVGMPEQLSGDPAPLPAVPADQPVYVLFTSGSTGEPKGVVIPSEALCNRLLWMRDEYAFGPEDRILQKTPYTFDVSVWELLGTLISGACEVIAPPESHRDPGRLAELIVRERVTICHFVPSMLEEFLRWPEAAECRSLRLVVCSGEALGAALARSFVRTLAARLHNLYGPTEAAIDVTAWACPADERQVDKVLIGTPIANCTLVVLDADGRPVPAGEPGELCIGGVPLAIGYLNRPDLTAAAFVEAPAWCPVPRLYRTGDRVRWTDDGFEYLGRLDDQVKIRGHRVEPLEIEAQLAAHPRVAEAAVVAVRDAGGDAELRAFFVPGPGSGDPDELADRLLADLAGRLPAAFVPSRIAALPSMPVNRHGKLDRRRLRELAQATAPRRGADDGDDPLEQLWRAALRVDEVPPDLSFLAAGGHSLAAVRMVAMIRERWGTRLPLSALLIDDPTPTELRDRLGEPTAPPDRSPAGTTRSRVPLAPEQRRLWFWRRLNPESTAYNVVGALLVHGPADLAALRAALARLAERQEALRITIADTGSGEAEQQLWPEVTVDIVHRRAADDPDQRVAVAFAAELARTVFEPGRLPLFQVGVLEGPGQWALAVVLDHLIADEHSLELFFTELAALYAGREDALDAVPTPYRDVAAEPRDAEAVAADLRHWARRMPGTVPAELPFTLRGDHPRRDSDTVEIELDAAATAAVDAFRARTGTTVAATFLAAVTRTVAAWTGQDGVVVGVPSAGRETVAAQRVIGFFVRTLPVPLEATGGSSGVEAVRRARTALVEAAEHGNATYDEVVTELRRWNPGTPSELFRVWFNDLTQARRPERFGDHPATPVIVPPLAALFDLNVYLGRTPAGRYTVHLAYPVGRLTADVVAELGRQIHDRLAEIVGGADPGRIEDEDPGEPAPAGGHYGDLVRAVREHAECHPGRPALRTDDGAVDYGTLARRIEVIAGTVGEATPPGAAVAVLAARVPDLPAALLGCWAAGRVPLILDGAAPAAWRDAAITAAGCALVIDLTAGPVFRPGPGGPAMPGAGHLLATSGTTGEPAVVLLPVDALPATFSWYARELRLDADDRFMLGASIANDPMLRELVLPLVLGAEVHLGATDPGRRLRLLRDAGVTVLNTTPSHAELLLAGAAGDRLPALRRAVFHGEPLTDETAAAVAAVAPRAELYNLYGTAETPQASSLYRWRPPGDPATEWRAARRTVPIGRGTPLRRLTVVRPDGRPAAPGEVGELVVSGEGLALGYAGVRRADRFGAGPRGRLFRTGDRARRDLDGDVELLGRLDRQVSLAGYRVDLDGVERVLAALPGVRRAVVDLPAGGTLTAWYVAADEAPAGDALPRLLRDRLPAWSVPVQLIRVTHIPVGRTGKVDLAALTRQAPITAAAPASPEGGGGDAVQRVLDAVRAELADADGVRATMTFFEAGLTSIALLRLHARLSTDFGLRFPVAELFRYTTPVALARRLTELSAGVPAAPRAPVDIPATNAATTRRAIRRRLSAERGGNEA